MAVTLTVPCPPFGLFDRDPNTVLETQVRRPTLTKLERMASYNCATMRRLSTSRLTCRYVRGVVAATRRTCSRTMRGLTLALERMADEEGDNC